MNGIDRKRFVNGLVLWGLATALTAYPEIKAALNPPGWANPHWHTISHTIGDLEQQNHWVGLVVVGVIVVIAAYGIHLQSDNPSPAVAGRSAEEASQSQLLGDRDPVALAFAYLLLTALVSIGGGVLLASSSPYDSFHVEYWMYGCLAVLLVIVPLVIAWRLKREVPFTSLFETVRIIESKVQPVAVLLLAALVVLLIHLALYPWPNFNHFPAS